MQEYGKNSTDCENGEEKLEKETGVAESETQEAAEENREKKERFFQRKGVRKATGLFSAVFLLVGAFFGGFFVHKATLPREINSLLWAKEQIQSGYYGDIGDEEFYAAVFSGVNGILDEYSGYMTKEEYEESRRKSAGEFSGLGLYFTTKNSAGEDCLLVTRVAGGSPAEEAGICAGSRIVAFGKTATEWTESENFEDFSAFLSQFSAGEKFYVKESRYPYGEENTRSVCIEKRNFTENYVYYRSNTASYAYLGEDAVETERGSALASLRSDTAYISLAQFNGNAAAEFDAAMARFVKDGKKKLVLDLRGNGGGDMGILCSIASYFCKGATEKEPAVAKAIYKGGKEEIFEAKSNAYASVFGDDGKVYVLADSSSASASEGLIGCMLDYGCVSYEEICISTRGEKVKTFGKGIMQTTRMRFPWSSEAIKLTTAKICWPLTGNCIHGRGVIAADGTKVVAESYAADEEIRNALLAFGLAA